MKKIKVRKLKKREVFLSLLLGEILLGIGLITSLFLLNQHYSNMQKERNVGLASLSAWESKIKKFPNQPQAYVAASLYALRLNDRQKAHEYATKAVFLDPSLEKLTQLQDLLGK